MLRRWLPPLFCLWLLVITYRYANVVVRAFYSPLNPGNDLEWFAAWTAAALVLMLAALTRRSLVIVFSIFATAAVVVLLLSGTFVAAMIACGILLLAHLSGRAMLSIMRANGAGPAVTVPLGLIPQALGGFALAAFHMLTPVTIALMLGGLAVASLLFAKPAGLIPPALGKPLGMAERLPVLLMFPVMFLNLIWAVVPEIQYDANNYHLAVAQSYLGSHGFIDLPYFFHSYLYRLIDMLFTIGLALQGAEAAKLLSFSFGLVAAYGVFSLGRLAFDERTGAWAAAVFYTTPIVSWVSGTANTDNAVAMLIAATVIAFLSWLRSKDRIGSLYAAALLAGAVVAAKVNAVFALPAMLTVALWKLRARPRAVAVCGLLVVMVALPWYALTYVWTGNPVFPLFNGIFQSPLWDAENRIMDSNAYGIGTSAASLLRIPFRLTWNTTLFGAATPQGAAGTALLLALPFGAALLTRKHRLAAAVLFGTVAVYFVLWMFTFQYARYLVLILPLVAVIGVATVFHFSVDRWTRAISRICLALLLVLQFPVTSIMFWNITDRFPVSAALGMESREHFLRRSLRAYAAVEYLNRVVKPGERVAGIDVEDIRFYLKAPLETVTVSTLGSVLRLPASTSSERVATVLGESRFSYVLATRDSLKDPPPWCRYIQPEFLDRFTTIVFHDANAVVYRLNRQAAFR